MYNTLLQTSKSRKIIPFKFIDSDNDYSNPTPFRFIINDTQKGRNIIRPLKYTIYYNKNKDIRFRDITGIIMDPAFEDGHFDICAFANLYKNSPNFHAMSMLSRECGHGSIQTNVGYRRAHSKCKDGTIRLVQPE